MADFKAPGFPRGGFHENKKCLAFRGDARVVETWCAGHALDKPETIHFGAHGRAHPVGRNQV